MQETKSKTWCITINETEDCPLPSSKDLITFFENLCSEYVFQKEQGLISGRLHWQCAIKLKLRRRKSTLLNIISANLFTPFQWQIEPCYGTWDEATAYCRKDDTRLPGEYVHSNLITYSGSDVSILDDTNLFFNWQKHVFNSLFNESVYYLKKPDDRQIFWVADFLGCSGKSKFTKWICLRNSTAVKIPFGSASQLRSSIISTGPKKLYILDIPRTIGLDDDMRAIYSLLEDLKNGFVVSSMYGKNSTLMMDPPHVLVFSNKFPDVDKMSRDRWVTLGITPDGDIMNCNTPQWKMFYEATITNSKDSKVPA